MLAGFIQSMRDQKLKASTIEFRKFFATQFLKAVEEQGLHSPKNITTQQLGSAMFAINSTEGLQTQEKAIGEYPTARFIALP